MLGSPKVSWSSGLGFSNWCNRDITSYPNIDPLKCSCASKPLTYSVMLLLRYVKALQSAEDCKVLRIGGWVVESDLEIVVCRAPVGVQSDCLIKSRAYCDSPPFSASSWFQGAFSFSLCDHVQKPCCFFG